MNCFYHQDTPAVAQCSGCGKFLCPSCIVESEQVYCESCYEEQNNEKIRDFKSQLKKNFWQSIAIIILIIVSFVVGYFYSYYNWEFSINEALFFGLIVSNLVSVFDIINIVKKLFFSNSTWVFTLSIWFIFTVIKIWLIIVVSIFAFILVAPILNIVKIFKGIYRIIEYIKYK